MSPGAGVPAAALLLALAVWAQAGRGATLIQGPSPERDAWGAPYHGSPEGIAWGGHGELRFGHDREAGVSNPEWFSVGRVNGFALARLGPRVTIAGQGAYDRGTDDFVLERAEMDVRVRASTHLHAGIFLAPLGATNLRHDAPQYEFAERSLVATQLIGVPYAELGVGVKGSGRDGRLSYEVDLVTGYDEGIVTEAPGGTRVPSGRNNYGDENGVPALAGRIALRSSPSSEIGFGAQVGQYNETTVSGASVDRARYAYLAVADATARIGRFRVFTESAFALVDVPPGLRGLYAERQWGGSVEIARTLRDPIVRGWRSSSLSVALRGDAVDFDREVMGDSRHRVSASLNVHHLPLAVARLGWYYEIRRDRFNNDTPFAGITLTTASYF